jgi:hypothetical protein
MKSVGACAIAEAERCQTSLIEVEQAAPFLPTTLDGFTGALS